jgi:thiamine biosynthesis lipoprotein
VTEPAAASEQIVDLHQIMGMPILVDVRDDAVDEDALGAVFEWFQAVDATFSTFEPGSEVSRIARGELRAEDASPNVQEVLVLCEGLRQETDGYFDAYATGCFDPSGLVKGWSVDHAAAMLDRAGVENFAVKAGGDIRLVGGARPDSSWRVGIQHPARRDRIAAVVEGHDLAVATSGAYGRGEHVLDPHTRRPPTGILSVTITGPDLATADAYATAAFAMGADRAPAWTATLPNGYEAMTILAPDRVLTTPAFPRAERLGALAVTGSTRSRGRRVLQ